MNARPLPHAEKGGWQVSRSITIELHIALWLMSQPSVRSFDPLLDDLAAPLDADWHAERSAFFGDSLLTPDSFWSDLAFLSDALPEESYSRATLPMRELTPARALARLGLSAPHDAGAEEIGHTLALGLTDYFESRYQALGLDLENKEWLGRQAAERMPHLMAVLQGGERHARFWHWMDRFYYQAYEPWLERRAPFLTAAAERAAAGLGAQAGEGAPKTDWLPPQHPLRNRSALRQAMLDDGLSVFFLLEPFGILDMLELDGRQVYATFGEPGVHYIAFREHAQSIAQRVKALSDPTRLTILRLIRYFAMDNTEMAEFLEISRPAVSVHTKILREAGLIESRQAGRQARHTVKRNEVRRLLEELEDFLK
ncbi:MAG: winged helix-turn-helix transcriptional regulator [Caldilineaceae bacterium]|nr:winged helix-turn-helix transcriptional regulator [Caldilineaceae bacterium]